MIPQSLLHEQDYAKVADLKRFDPDTRANVIAGFNALNHTPFASSDISQTIGLILATKTEVFTHLLPKESAADVAEAQGFPARLIKAIATPAAPNTMEVLVITDEGYGVFRIPVRFISMSATRATAES